MEIDADNARTIQTFLSFPGNEGFNWVAFDQDVHGRMKDLQGFVSAVDAGHRCENYNATFNYIEQDFVDANYRYMPADTLRKVLEPPAERSEAMPDPAGLIARLKVDGVMLLGSYALEDVYRHIRDGTVFPVEYRRVIDPLQEVDRFVVIAHHHAGHQVYETGHSAEVLEPFLTKHEAEACLSSETKQYRESMDDKKDYLLAGLYRGQEMKLTPDGMPMDHSGLVLKTAMYRYHAELQAKAWEVNDVRDLEKPLTIRNFLFAQYDAGTK